MLQRNNAEVIVNGAEPQSSDHSELYETISFVFGLLHRRYLVILLFTLLAAGAGVTYLQVAPPTYTADAQIIIGTESAPFVQQQSVFSDRGIDSPQLESQIQIIQSKAIASTVVEKLKLMDDPEFTGSSGGLIRRVFKFLSKPNPTIAESDTKETAIAALTERLKVSRVGFSFVIEISFSSQNAEKAAQIANAVANAYIEDQAASKRQANRTANSWLYERMQELGEQSAAAEREVLAFKERNAIVSVDGKLMDDQRVADLNSRLVAARAQTADLFARLSRIEAIIRTGTPSAVFQASVTEVLTSPIFTKLREQYLDLARREAEYSIRYGRNHLAVVNIRNRMQELRSSTFDELRRLADSYKSDYEIAKQRQEEIEKQLADAVSESQATNKARVKLSEIESRAKSLHTLYETFLQRQTGSAQQESFPISDTRLLSVASTPTSKSKPKTLLVLALALMGGTGLGVGCALLLDLMDRGFHTGTQLQAVLQMSCIALVPLLKGTGRNQLQHNQSPSDKRIGQRTIARGSGVFWSVVDQPSSPFAESIRSIKLAMNVNMTSRPNKVVGFTSSLPNEGKSTIAAAFALLTAQLGARVILVDCDLRNPSLSRSLAPEARIGLVDVISGAKSLEEVVWRDPTNRLVLLPAVKDEASFHTSELLGAESTKKLFEKLCASFDYVVVDLPPLAPVVDVRAAIHLVDSAILVVEWGHTRIDVVRHALTTAPNVHEALIGAVLNKTQMDRIKQYDSQYGVLYESRHYARYG
jgi:exopolysaccharide transport family protein